MACIGIVPSNPDAPGYIIRSYTKKMEPHVTVTILLTLCLMLILLTYTAGIEVGRASSVIAAHAAIAGAGL